jgi:hypothetical protein
MQIYEEAFNHPGRAKKDERIVLILNPKEAKQLYEMSKEMTKAFPRRQLWKTWHTNFYNNLPF